MTRRDADTLTRLLADRLAEAPPAPPLADVVEHCRRDLRRHHGRMAVVAVVAAVLGILVPTLALGHDRSGPDRGPGPAGSDAETVDGCRSALDDRGTGDLLTASGPPVVASVHRTPERTVATVVSADGRYWAVCRLWPDELTTPDADRAPTASALLYDAEARSPRAAYEFTAGRACPGLQDDLACPSFEVVWVARLPRAVASVTFETVDGVETTVPADEHGLVGFVHLGDVPTELVGVEVSWPQPWLVRITYRDATGRPIAAGRLDRPSAGGQHRVDGLPLYYLAYPAIGAEVR